MIDSTHLLYQSGVDLTSRSIWAPLGLVILVNLLLGLTGQYLLLSDELYFNALSERMSFEQIKILIEQNKQWSWLGHIILLATSVFKFTLVASCISLGYYFIIDRWMFKPFLRIAIQAELILQLPSIIKIFWFLLIQPDYSLSDLQYFYPLSLLNLFDIQTLSSYILYPLQLVNLFELAYWFVLAYGVSQVVKIPMPRAFGLVAASYGSGLLIWVLFVMFLTVSLS